MSQSADDSPPGPRARYRVRRPQSRAIEFWYTTGTHGSRRRQGDGRRAGDLLTRVDRAHCHRGGRLATLVGTRGHALPSSDARRRCGISRASARSRMNKRMAFVTLVAIACGGRTDLGEFDVVPIGGEAEAPIERGVDASGNPPDDVTSGVSVTDGCAGHIEGPVTLASQQDIPGSIEVDSASVYWPNRGACYVEGGRCSGTVMKVSKCGGTPVTVASQQAFPGSVAVDAENVYWTNAGMTVGSGAVMKVSLGGGTPQTLASGQAQPDAIALESTSVYWTTYGSDPVPGTVMRVSKVGGPVTTLASGYINGGIAVDSMSVYWTGQVCRRGVGCSGTVMKLALGGGSPLTLASGPNPSSIAVDSTSAYWAAYGSHGSLIMKVALGGGNVETLASGQDGPSRIAVDATGVYWGDVGGTVMKVALDGGTPTTLASALNVPSGIAVDTTNVYWTDLNDYGPSGTVMSVSK